MVAQAESPPHDRRELCSNLLRRALDPAAREGEARIAIDKFFLIARSDGITHEHIGTLFEPQRKPRVRRPSACSIKMDQGKYSGRKLGWIARNDLDYLRWMSEKFDDWWIRQAAATVLDHFTQGQQ
jgi:hypothetical protein